MSQIFAVPDEANLDHLIFSDDPVMSAFAQWLVLESGPDDWHLVADGWNWDEGEDPLWWIVTRPNCDRATALMVFWGTKPYHYLGLPPWEATDAAEYDLYHTIRARWAAGFYTRSEIAFDIASAKRALAAVKNHLRFGFNYDPSHLGYQGVDYVKFIREFGDRIFHAHMKDVWWGHGDGTVGVFGGHVDFTDARRYWDFRSLGQKLLIEG